MRTFTYFSALSVCSIGCSVGASVGPDESEATHKSVDAIFSDGGKECASMEPQPHEKKWTIDSDGIEREYRVFVPSTYNPKLRTPVVFNFHGFALSPRIEEWLTDLSAKAEAEGFILVYPKGTGILFDSFNGGACCGTAATGGTDDVGFTAKMLDAIESTMCVDRRRVFASGFSSGAFLAHRLGCELSSRIAAVAAVSGTLSVEECNPSRPVPVVSFHGMKDKVIPYDGRQKRGWTSAPDSFARWAKINRCSDKPVESMPGPEVMLHAHSECQDGAEVELWSLPNGRHAWPGGRKIARGTRALSANDRIWEFFQNHPMPE